MPNEKTCTAVNPKTGTRCGQPANDGHKSHSNGTLCVPWRTELKEISITIKVRASQETITDMWDEVEAAATSWEAAMQKEGGEMTIKFEPKWEVNK